MHITTFCKRKTKIPTHTYTFIVSIPFPLVRRSLAANHQRPHNKDKANANPNDIPVENNNERKKNQNSTQHKAKHRNEEIKEAK